MIDKEVLEEVKGDYVEMKQELMEDSDVVAQYSIGNMEVVAALLLLSGRIDILTKTIHKKVT